jgi:hypothetical protein
LWRKQRPPRLARGYHQSLELVPAEILARGASKSAVSRHLIAHMKLREQLTRRLEQVDVLVLMIDGIEIARRTVVVALGILCDERRLASHNPSAIDLVGAKADFVFNDLR